jgi:hypothetical protein
MWWTLFLLLSNLDLSLSASVEEISAHVHVAANDQLIAFARNRDREFRFTLNPSETSRLILRLAYNSVETETVRSLSIPAQTSSLEPIQLVFIGGPRNSSERILFHAKLKIDEDSESLSVIHLWNTSITSLSSVGMECALGMHPLGTYVVIVGDRGGYIYDMEKSSGQYWSAWERFTDNYFPRAISVTLDNYILVGVNVQMIDITVPDLYIAVLDAQNMTEALFSSHMLDISESTSARAPISITARGYADEGPLIMFVGFPSEDAVYVVILERENEIVVKKHISQEKGINFGQAVILTDNGTYGVLSSALETSPWSTGRVQVRRSFFVARGSNAHRLAFL